MYSVIRVLSLRLSIAILLSCWCVALGGAQQEGQVSFNLSVASMSFSEHEPIVLEMNILNGLPRVIYLDLGQDREENVEITATLPDGKMVTSRGHTHEGISVIGVVSIQPGGTYSQRLLLNKWFDLSSKGKYLIGVNLVKSPALQGSSETVDLPIESHVEFEITDRDEKRLSKACESLASRVVNSSSFEDASDAAKALSYISDPLAIPYLKQVLQSGKLVEANAIEGFLRIGNRQAVEALIEASNSPNKETGLLSRSALVQLEKSTKDSSLQEIIHAALNPAGARPNL